MAVLDDVIGLDFYLVQKHVRKLIAIERLQLRRTYLHGVRLDDGQRVHDLTQAALLERWAEQRQHQQHQPQQPGEGGCEST